MTNTDDPDAGPSSGQRPPDLAGDPLAAMVAAEARGLRVSIWIALVLSVAALVLGIVASTRVLVFEGAYGVIGIAMSWLALRASRTADTPPSARYPFGRNALTPLIVVVQGLAVAATIVFAAADAVIVILDGGQRVEAAVVVVYSTISAVASIAFAVWLRRNSGGSDLIAAEAIQWKAGAVRGFVAAAGALVALLLAALSFEAALDYVDPVLVLISCALISPLPVRMLRHGLNELLEGSPDGHTLLAIERAVDGVTARFDLPGPTMRSTKLGAKLYVDVVYLVDGDTVTIAREDEVRRATIAALHSLPYDVWANVELTADPALAE
jgi:predicted Co/Zn/Cd cation transporter (cation efflux family)